MGSDITHYTVESVTEYFIPLFLSVCFNLFQMCAKH